MSHTKQAIIAATLMAVMAFNWTGVKAGGAGSDGNSNPQIFAPDSEPYGSSYSEWEAAFWKWALELPLKGHPFNDDAPNYDFSAHQSGRVWFWSAPEEVFTRTATMPEGVAIFLTTLDVECSSLEAPPFHGDTEDQQRMCAEFWADHIEDVFVIIDGVEVKNVADYRVAGEQITFTAPTPWVFGDVGGTGTSVGDGYYFMIKPLKPGHHTIEYGGRFHFQAGELGNPEPFDLVKDVTIQLTVVKDREG